MVNGYNMSESIEVGIFNTYEGTQLVCPVEVYSGSNLVKKWTVEEPGELLNQAIESSEPDVFVQVRMKQMLSKAMDLFEPNKITLEVK